MKSNVNGDKKPISCGYYLLGGALGPAGPETP